MPKLIALRQLVSGLWHRATSDQAIRGPFSSSTTAGKVAGWLILAATVYVAGVVLWLYLLSGRVIDLFVFLVALTTLGVPARLIGGALFPPLAFVTALAGGATVVVGAALVLGVREQPYGAMFVAVGVAVAVMLLFDLALQLRSRRADQSPD
jgi:hypothetical protein